MTWLIFLIIVFLFVIWAICRVASDADDEMEGLFPQAKPRLPRDE